jgi:hypothetical protein
MEYEYLPMIKKILLRIPWFSATENPSLNKNVVMITTTKLGKKDSKFFAKGDRKMDKTRTRDAT